MPDFNQIKQMIWGSAQKISGKDLLKHGGHAKEYFKTFAKGGGMAAVKQGAVAAAAYGSNLIVPGAGILGGIAAEASIYFFGQRNQFKQGKKPTQPGDWVAIDQGAHNIGRKIDEQVLGGIRDLRRRLGATPGLQANVSIGFYIQDGTGDTYQIYDFESRSVKEFPRDEILLLDSARQIALTNRKLFGTVRKEILLAKSTRPEGSLLQGSVNVDPGSEVMFQGDAYNVVSSENNVVFISNKKESRHVRYKLLSAGRQRHTAGYRYGETNTTPGFVKDNQPLFYANQWVWLVPPRQSSVRDAKDRFDVIRELGVVRLINGNTIDGYYAIDGVRFQRSEHEVQPASPSERGWLSLDKDFGRFKDTCATGEGTRRLRLGGDYLGICLGQTAKMEEPVLDWAAREFSDEGQVSGRTPGLAVAGGTQPIDSTEGTPAQQESKDRSKRHSEVSQSKADKVDEVPSASVAGETNIVFIGGGVAALVILMYFGS